MASASAPAAHCCRPRLSLLRPLFVQRWTLAPALGRRFIGQLALDAALDYNADMGEFYLVDPRIQELELANVPDKYRSLARQLAEQIGGRYLDRFAVYRLDPDDFEESLAKLVLQNVAVTGGRLVIFIGLL